VTEGGREGGREGTCLTGEVALTVFGAPIVASDRLVQLDADLREGGKEGGREGVGEGNKKEGGREGGLTQQPAPAASTWPMYMIVPRRPPEGREGGREGGNLQSSQDIMYEETMD